VLQRDDRRVDGDELLRDLRRLIAIADATVAASRDGRRSGELRRGGRLRFGPS